MDSFENSEISSINESLANADEVPQQETRKELESLIDILKCIN